MPKAEEGNRTESGKIEHVQSNVASANKWCKCRQVAAEGQCGQREEIRLKIACADKCGICWQMLLGRKNVAKHVDGEKAMKERTLEARQ